jgi:Flp pilus assembly protein TadG
MILVAPILLALLMGAFEMGNYFRSEHILVEGLRDGARYAARQPFANYKDRCGASIPNTDPVWSQTQNIVRTGQVSGGTDRLPNWASASVQFNVTVTCLTMAGGQTMSGIYNNNTNTFGSFIGAPVVTVTAQVPYRPVVAKYGFSGIGLTISGNQQAAVMGI